MECSSKVLLLSFVPFSHLRLTSHAPVTFSASDHFYQFSASTWAVDREVGNFPPCFLWSFNSCPSTTHSVNCRMNKPVSHSLDRLSNEWASSSEWFRAYTYICSERVARPHRWIDLRAYRPSRPSRKSQYSTIHCS